jgi:hypothetical protein
VLLVGLGPLLGPAPSVALAQTPTAGETAPGPNDPWAELLPAERGAVAGRFGDDLSSYRIDAALDPASGTIAGVAEVRYRNTAGVPLEEVWFRLFPNAGYYREGRLTVAGVTVSGAPTKIGLALEETALRVALPEPLPPGDATTLRLPFEAVVPADSGGSYGIFGRDTETGSWVLAGWHPTLAVYDPGAGWNLTPPTAAGDPTYAASSLFDVRLTLPAGLAVVATGVEVEAADGEGRGAGDGGEPVARRFVAGPAREFTMVVDATYVPSRVEAGEVAVVAWSEPAHAEMAARAAARAAADVAAYGERFGAYPFRELELVQAPLEGALAVAWSGLVFLDGDSLLGAYGAGDRLAFETVVAHETAHLWWGALAGTDSNRHPWIQEGLATVSSLGALAWAGDPAAAEASLDVWVLGPARRLLTLGDAVADRPVTAGGDETARSLATYGKGSLGFLAIRREIGDEAFWAALGDVAEGWRFRIFAPDDLLAAFERRSGEELDALWNEWFAGTVMTAAKIAAVAEGFAADPPVPASTAAARAQATRPAALDAARRVDGRGA